MLKVTGSPFALPCYMQCIINLCSRTKEIYIDYMHFQGFLLPKKRLGSGLSPGPRWGAYSASQTPLLRGEGTRSLLHTSHFPSDSMTGSQCFSDVFCYCFYARQLYRQVLLRARISYGNSVRLSVRPSVTTRWYTKHR